MADAQIPLTNMRVSAKLVFAASLALWVLALVSFIIAFANSNNPADADKQKSYNFWQTLGSTFTWVQILTLLALIGTPNLFGY